MAMKPSRLVEPSGDRCVRGRDWKKTKGCRQSDSKSLRRTNCQCQRELGENQTRCNLSRTEVLMGKELLMNWRKRQDFLFCTKLKEEAICSVCLIVGSIRADEVGNSCVQTRV